MPNNTYDGITDETSPGAGIPIASDWIEATRSILLSGRQEERNVLAAPYTDGSGILQFSYALGGIVPGVRLSVGTTTFYVLSVSNSSLSATVLAAQEGSADTVAATGALVRVAPRFTDFEIFTALNADLADLSGPGTGLFQIKTAELTYSDAAIGYDLGTITDLIDIYDVRYQNRGTFSDWPRIPKMGWRLDRYADTTVFPSGLALQVFGPAMGGLKVRVLYRAGFGALLSENTDVSTTGLPATAYDLPPLGAALRIASSREIKRSFTEAQGDTRRAAEVPAGAALSALRGVAAQREQRIQSEAQRLMARYPDRRW